LDTRTVSPTDAVEQLVLTPHLPPESAKYVYRSLYPSSKDEKAKDTSTASYSIDSRNIGKDDIPFGQSANSRPTSPHLNQQAKMGNNGDIILSPLSPAFASISPLHATRKILDANDASITRPVRSSSLSDASSSKGKDDSIPSEKKPFHAMLLQPVPSFPADLSDEEKLINVHVGGSKVYTTRLSSITSHSTSHLARLLSESLTKNEKSSSPTNIETSQQNTPIHDAPEELRLTKRVQSIEAHLSDKYIEPATVILNLPTSPIDALRSARASIYDDIPSDEKEEGEYTTTETEIFGNYANVKSFRDKLEVPFPNPRNNRLRFSRNHSDDNVNNKGDSNATASSSEYASTEAEDEFSVNFLDTTPDDEDGDPFNLQSAQPSPLPSNTSVRKTQEDTYNKKEAELSKESLESRYSNSSSSLHIPSLSSSPNSSAYQVDSPILLSGAAKQFMGGITTTSGAFENLITQHEQHVLHPINVYLDRSAEPYDAIFHFIRTGVLPRKLCLDDALYRLSDNNKVDSNEVSIQNVLDSLPIDTRKKLLPLVLHPIMSEIKDLKEEAEYLGFTILVELCEVEISKLKKMIRWSRTVVAHPGLHFRSESEGGIIKVKALQQQQRQQQSHSPRLLDKQANRPRPRLTGHRHYDSESRILPRPAKKEHAHDNWI